jgi:hypothetical protein
MAHVSAALDAEVIHFTCLSKTGCGNEQCHNDHGEFENILSHNHLVLSY